MGCYIKSMRKDDTSTPYSNYASQGATKQSWPTTCITKWVTQALTHAITPCVKSIFGGLAMLTAKGFACTVMDAKDSKTASHPWASLEKHSMHGKKAHQAGQS